MIKFLDVGYLINCRHKIKQEDKLVVTSCILKVIRHKIKNGLYLFLEKFEIIKDFVKNYYSTISGKRRRRSPKKIAGEMAQLLELKGYADIAFLFRVIARYYIRGLEEHMEETLLQLSSKVSPINFIVYLRNYFKKQNNYVVFPDKVVDSIRKELQQNNIEIPEIDDRELWLDLDSGTDREDRYQLLCIEKYMRNHGIAEARFLTTDHRLPDTAQPFENIKVEIVDCQA
ncbi:MAG: hypothetical protein ACO2PM_16645 [Pyrobaculum sp.]|jgi:hemerythrin-like domain-containing protein